MYNIAKSLLKTVESPHTTDLAIHSHKLQSYTVGQDSRALHLKELTLSMLQIDSIWAIFMTINICHFSHICYKRCTFCCDRSISHCTILHGVYLRCCTDVHISYSPETSHLPLYTYWPQQTMSMCPLLAWTIKPNLSSFPDLWSVPIQN